MSSEVGYWFIRLWARCPPHSTGDGQEDRLGSAMTAEGPWVFGKTALLDYWSGVMSLSIL